MIRDSLATPISTFSLEVSFEHPYFQIDQSAHLAIKFKESKYSHAAVWPIVSGYTKADGSRNYPVTAMVRIICTSEVAVG